MDSTSPAPSRNEKELKLLSSVAAAVSGRWTRAKFNYVTGCSGHGDARDRPAVRGGRLAMLKRRAGESGATSRNRTMK